MGAEMLSALILFKGKMLQNTCYYKNYMFIALLISPVK